MTSINLATKEEENPSSSLAKEWAVCIAVIIFLFLVYAGLLIYDRFLIKSANSLNGEYESQNNSLMESGKNVFDFQNRLEIAKPLVSQKNYALESLDQIGKLIIAGVYVESFIWDSGKEKISMECVAVDYRLVANQIASFKKSDYFSEVTVNETNNRDDGKVSFVLELAIKNKTNKKIK